MKWSAGKSHFNNINLTASERMVQFCYIKSLNINFMSLACIRNPLSKYIILTTTKRTKHHYSEFFLRDYFLD